MKEFFSVMIVCNSEKGIRQRIALEMLSPVSFISQIRFNL